MATDFAIVLVGGLVRAEVRRVLLIVVVVVRLVLVQIKGIVVIVVVLVVVVVVVLVALVLFVVCVKPKTHDYFCDYYTYSHLYEKYD